MMTTRTKKYILAKEKKNFDEVFENDIKDDIWKTSSR